VYAGIWNGNACAIKRFYVEADQESDFIREMTLLQRLRHPHILNFYGAVVSGSHPDIGHAQCLVTERCQFSVYKALQRWGKARHRRLWGYSHAALYISFVIPRIKYTGRRETDFNVYT
jgi:serine/threonine protein kinase